MRYHWPKNIVPKRVELILEDRTCPGCSRRLTICDHRYRQLYTLDGAVELVCKLLHCPDPSCSSRPRTFSPPAELTLAPPNWMIGWDVFAWIGHRRFARHWSVPQLRDELLDRYQIPLSADALEQYIRRYQLLVAARQQDPQVIARDYRDIRELILSIDGLQPEKGHETLYTVRELNARRVWFAQPLLSSTAAEIQVLFAQARLWADGLGLPVKLWMSDKQDAFVKGVTAEFAGVPHRYCANHFVRDLAKPVLEADSHAKVQMRKKVRGLRTIEQEVLAARRVEAEVEQVQPESSLEQSVTTRPTDGSVAATPAGVAGTLSATASPQAAARPVPCPALVCGPDQDAAAVDPAGEVVLGYCAAVRGILNDDQGGPLEPPGLRMADALQEVKESLERNVEAGKGGRQKAS